MWKEVIFFPRFQRKTYAKGNFKILKILNITYVQNMQITFWSKYTQHIPYTVFIMFREELFYKMFTKL